MVLTSKGIEPSGIKPVLSSITMKGVSGERQVFVAVNVVDAIEEDVIIAFALALDNCFVSSSENFYHVYL